MSALGLVMAVEIAAGLLWNLFKVMAGVSEFVSSFERNAACILGESLLLARPHSMQLV